MTCPSCGAPMHLVGDKEYLRCDYCASVHFPDLNSEGVRILDEPAGVLCPVCELQLVHAAIAGQRMLYCTHCHGMLISMGCFAGVIQDLRAGREASAITLHATDFRDLERRILCPQCGQMMDTHPYGGPGNIVIDDCERCSLNWLDYGELQRIVRAPDRRYNTQGI